MTLGRQPGAAAGQVEDAAALPLEASRARPRVPGRRIDATSPVSRAPGPTSTKSGRPAVQVFDLGDEFDRPGQLAGRAGPGPRRSSGYGGRGAVGEDRQTAPGPKPPRSSSRGRLGRRRRPGGCGMPPPRPAASSAPAASAKAAAARSMSAARPGEDGLLRRVLVGHTRSSLRLCRTAAIASSGAWTASIAARGRRPVGLGHQPAARRRQACRVRRLDPAGRAQGDQLAVTVAGDRIGTNAEALQHAQAARLTAPRAGWATSVARRAASLAARVLRRRTRPADR